MEFYDLHSPFCALWTIKITIFIRFSALGAYVTFGP